MILFLLILHLILLNPNMVGVADVMVVLAATPLRVGVIKVDLLRPLIFCLDNYCENVSNASQRRSFLSRFSGREYYLDGRFKNNFRLIEKSKMDISSFDDSVKSWKKKIVQIRNNLSLEVIGQISEPFGGLIISMIFGKSEYFPKQLNHSFRVIGMQHVVAASGYNVSLILRLTHWCVTRFKRFYRLLFLVGALYGYAFATDLGPPMIRAVGMASLCLATQYFFHRQYQPVWSLLLVSSLMVILNPAFLTSISFQLSVTATLGICLVVPLLTGSPGSLAQALTGQVTAPKDDQNSSNRLWSVAAVRQVLTESFITTCAAQLLTLPLLLLHFQEFSWLSIPANTFLLWLTPLITTGGVVYLGLGSLITWLTGSPLFSGVVAQYLWLPAATFVWSATFLGQFEQSLWSVTEFGWDKVFLWWVVVLGGIGLIYLRKKSGTVSWFYEKG